MPKTRAGPTAGDVEWEAKKKKKKQPIMAVLPAAWGRTHINMSGMIGSKEEAHRNGDEEGGPMEKESK